MRRVSVEHSAIICRALIELVSPIISFARGGGRKRSYLRLIEMAWPRTQAAPGTGSNRPGPVGGGGAGKAAAAVEQVLQSKLTGTVVASVYRTSPLALVLKPCFEGASSLLRQVDALLTIGEVVLLIVAKHLSSFDPNGNSLQPRLAQPKELMDASVSRMCIAKVQYCSSTLASARRTLAIVLSHRTPRSAAPLV
eukprot:s7576_g4.t1